MGRLVTDCVVEFSFIVLLRTYSQVQHHGNSWYMEILIRYRTSLVTRPNGAAEHAAVNLLS